MLSLPPIESENLKPYVCPSCADKKRHAIKLDVVPHGLADHVMGCPIKARKWRGKIYANLIDDCSGCEDFFYYDDDYLLCDPRTSVKN